MTALAKAVLSPIATGGSFDPLAVLSGFFGRLGAARRCAAAITADRRPATADLKVLGLDKMDFQNLSR